MSSFEADTSGLPQTGNPSPTMYQHPLAYLIGLEGVALVRAFAGEHPREFTLERLASVRRLLDDAQTLGDGVDVPPITAQAGYDGWAQTYDDPGNGIFALEEPWVHPLLEALPVGVAVDAACGTGRHAQYLVGLGHQVKGYDTSARMLEVARAKVPDASFEEADLRALPLDDNSADSVICSLSLAHLRDLDTAFVEFARVLRPGGHLVVSDTRGHFVGSRLYPLVQWTLNDEFGYVPGWFHPTSAYVRSAISYGFDFRDCQEPVRGQIVDTNDLPEPAASAHPEHPPNVWDLHPLAPDAANATYQGHPALIIWHFQLRQ